MSTSDIIQMEVEANFGKNFKIDKIIIYEGTKDQTNNNDVLKSREKYVKGQNTLFQKDGRNIDKERKGINTRF